MNASKSVGESEVSFFQWIFWALQVFVMKQHIFYSWYKIDQLLQLM